MEKAFGPADESQALDQFYQTAESISLDHGVLQKSRKAAVIPAPFRWSDVGNWSSLNDVADSDRDGNIRIGRIVDLGSRDSVLYGEDRLGATLGLQGMGGADKADATPV